MSIAVDRHGTRRGLGVDVVGAAVLAAMVFVVHPFGFLVHHPYWADETWVALLARAPLSRYVGLSSSTPIGWLLLVRLAPLGRDDLRIVTLVFAAGAVVMAYVVARCLPWRSIAVARLAGAVAGLVVLLAPLSLARNDLKQYTSDAFFALVVVALASRLEAAWSRRRLAQLTAVAVVATVFSTVVAFVTVALLAALVIVSVVHRAWDRVRELALAAAVVAVAYAAYLGIVVVPHDNPALRVYWQDAYLTGGPFHEIAVSWHRFAHLSFAFAMPALVMAALIGAGVVTLAVLDRAVIALAVPLLWIEMMAAGAAHRYPFLDRRTSHFLLVLSLTVIAIGVVGIFVAIASRSRAVAVVLLVAAAGSFWTQAEPFVRMPAIPDEDVRSQVLYVARHLGADDVVVVSLESSYGFAFDWPGARTAYLVDHSSGNANGYLPRVRNLTGVVYADGRDGTATTAAMRHALALARRAAAGAWVRPVRIWIVRTHLRSGEPGVWDDTFRTLSLRPALIAVGPEPLAVVDVGPAASRGPAARP